VNQKRFLRKSHLIWLLGALLAQALTVLPAHAAAQPWLWQIGTPDGNNTEFALSPSQWGKFKDDPLFVVGQSDPKTEWPYVQPGPNDNWAGSRQHTFTVLFGLKALPAAGACRLEVSLLDTHASGPPKLEIQINGRSYERNLPGGAGDASVNGEPAKGRPHKFQVEFPAELLRRGDNDIQIRTTTGSWLLYDWLGLAAPAGAELVPAMTRTVVSRVQAVPALQDHNGRQVQPVLVTLRHAGEPQAATLQLEGATPQPVTLQRGEQTFELAVPPVAEAANRKLTLLAGDRTLATRAIPFRPVRPMTVYILPHSHTDIGYTDIQTAIEAKQVNNLIAGIAHARRTASYPEGARFVWNVEVTWAADLYLNRLNETQRAEFFDAVKQGQVVLNGMYLNQLTGLCRPEELMQLFRYATALSQQTGVPIDSAMISDVPGYTWGTVTAMAQAGIKYFSTAPNYFDRIGTILREWENKPFYWEGPDGKSKVLVWIPFWGYAMSHVYHSMSLKLVDDFCNGLDKRGYPYDIAYVRWSGHGDNAVPDPAICDFVKDWNAKYTSPRFIISGTGEAFRAFEQKYGAQLPVVRGDWTPYWEDGAGSSALETAMNRHSSDRLVQAETLFAMAQPTPYPQAEFESAWNQVLLYSEHTWGAWCSISEPERKETREQWEIKKSYADQADTQSRELLRRALEAGAIPSPETASLEIINTLSWPRTELVLVPAGLSTAGDRVVDERGRAVPSQRLSSGDLAFLARDVPAFATRRYQFSAGEPKGDARATAQGTMLDSGKVRLRVDAATGGIAELIAKGIKADFVDRSGGETLNDFLYLPGDDLKDLKRNGPVTISVGEPGPLVASLVIESDAPGCNSLRRELRVVAGQDYVELINLVDKTRLQAKSYHDRQGKESLNFAFPFNVPGGEMRLDIPFGVMRPELDQMPSACKNWLTVGRWVDVSNEDHGITWVTLDAPLIQIGGLTATLLNSQTNPDVWRAHIEPSRKLYSWAMNNHWGTNYRAYQEGPTTFRFILRPHRRADFAEASRFATRFSQPLLARSACATAPAAPQLQVTPSDVLVTAWKPSQDGQAWILRLYGASGKASSAKIRWGKGCEPQAVFLSDLSEKPVQVVKGSVPVPGFGVVTLRAQFE